MKSIIKKTKENLFYQGIKAKYSVSKILNNEKGEGILTTLIFVAILIIAVVNLKKPISDGFGKLGNWFETKIVEKVQSALDPYNPSN